MQQNHPSPVLVSDKHITAPSRIVMEHIAKQRVHAHTLDSFAAAVGTPGFDAPSARSSHVMVAVDTDLFLHGGDDGILWRFSVEKMSWTKFDAGTPGKDAPSAQTGHAMCSDPEGRDLFLMGKSHLVLGGGKSPFVDGVGMLYLVLTS